MQFSKTALVLVILPFSIAATCDKSNALSWSTTSSGQAYDLLTCSLACGTNANCIVGCQQTACTAHCGGSTSSCYTSCLKDLCSAFYGSGSDSPNAEALQACYKSQLGCSGSKCRRMLKERATLTCTSSEGCYIDTKSTVFCLNKSTGDYRDESGGYGNVNTGKYSSAVSNGAASTSAAASTKAASSTKTSTATITGASNTATAATAGASQATSVTSASAAASATAKGQAEHLRVNAGVGLLGLVLGLVL